MTIDEIAAVAAVYLSTEEKTFGAINALAEVAGVHHSTVCGWKRTKEQRIPTWHARKIAKVLRIPLHLIRPDVWAPPAPRRSHAVVKRELISAD
jgi:hypothetical protein